MSAGRVSPAMVALLEHLANPPAYVVGSRFEGRVALIDVRRGRTARALLERELVAPCPDNPRLVELTDAGRAVLSAKR